jgi:hypothetical protein
MNLACTIEYLDDADVLGTVDGALTLQDARPAKGTIFVMLVSDTSPDGHPEQFDLLENADVSEHSDGTLRISCDSMRAEGEFGPGNSRVHLKVTPK